MDVAPPSTDPDRAGDASWMRSVAAWVVLGSGLVALFLGSSAIELVREQLHINCGMGQPGSEGADTWTCSDGLGYLGVAITLGGIWLLVIMLGALVARLVPPDRTARVLLVIAAGTSTTWILGWTWYGSNALVQDAYAPMTGAEYWELAIGPSAIASALGLAAGIVSLLLTGRLSRIVCIGAAVAFAVATVLQPGLGILTIPAAGLLSAAAFRTTTSLVSLARR